MNKVCIECRFLSPSLDNSDRCGKCSFLTKEVKLTIPKNARSIRVCFKDGLIRYVDRKMWKNLAPVLEQGVFVYGGYVDHRGHVHIEPGTGSVLVQDMRTAPGA